MNIHSIQLMGKGYKVRCADDEVQQLSDAVQMLNERLRMCQGKSGLSSREDIIMMTALNLCQELLNQSAPLATEDLQDTQAANLLAQQKGSK